MNARLLALCGLVLVLATSGCAGPRERAEAIKIEINPLRRTQPGDMCRYRAVRDGQGHEATAETWLLRTRWAARGNAGVDVSVLGPARAPASPSPREPGYTIKMSLADAGFTSAELIRLFHRPDLTTEGMLVVLGRDVKTLDGSTRKLPLTVLGKMRDARELTVTFQDAALVRGTYRIVVSDDLPVLGIAEAELDEEWTAVTPDGELKTEHRHEKLELVESQGAADSR